MESLPDIHNADQQGNTVIFIRQRFALRTGARAVSLAVAVMAASSAGAGAAPVPAPAEDAAEQIVVVTAQSRSQQIQNVPIAVQTLSGDILKDLGAANLADVAAFVPGLAINTSQATRPSIFLRGVGTEDFGIGTDSPVGIYMDGVYTGKTGGSLLNFNDVKRIEVLKGPQGTLFGRNAAAGAIAIVSNDPVDRVEASALVRGGTRGTKHAQFIYNTPLSDSIALRVSGVDQQDEGWARNTHNGVRMGDDGDRGVRAALRWRIGASSAILSAEHEVMRVAGPPVYSVTGGKINFGPATTWTNPLDQPLSNDAAPSAQSRTFDGVTLRLETALSFATLSSTTAYRHFNSTNFQDNDATSNPAVYLQTGNIESNATWQQEFKLSGQSGAFDWVAGLSAFRERATETESVGATTTSLDTLIGHAAGIAPYATLTALAQGIGRATGNAALQGINLAGLAWNEAIHDKGENRALAAYGDVIWHATRDTNLTLGARLTHDEKSFSWYNPVRSASALDAQLAALSAARVYNTAVALKLLSATQAATLQGVTTRNVEFNSSVATTTPYTSSTSWNNVSPRVVLDRHLTADNMVYASWSKGYQAGGFDAVSVNGHYDQELVTNIELGTKGQLRALGVTYGASVFHYNYTNLQSLTFVPANTGNAIPSYQVVNSDQRATGVDLDGQWKINRIWRVNGALEYLDQTYAGYVSPSGTNLGGQAAGAPWFSASVGVAATWPAWAGKADFNLMAGHQGEKRCNTETTSQGICAHAGAVGAGAARDHVDTRIGWTAPSGNWGLGLIVNNLLNRQYVNISTLGAAVGSPYAYVTRPRVFALELRGQL